MPKIRFLRNYTVKDGSGTSFAKGEELECSEDSAGHFISRQAAELVINKSKPVKSRAKPRVNADDKPGEPDAT